MVRSLIRFIGAGLLLLGLTGVSLAVFNQRVNKPAFWPVTLGVSSIVFGIILLAASGKMAERLTDDYD